MIISYHGALQLLLTAYSVIAVATAQNVTVPNNSNADSATYHAVTESKSNSTAENSNIKNETNAQSTVLRSKRAEPKENSTENVKFQRRAPRFDSAASSPWVRVYNRPPGTQTESFYNYETRGNTSAHTSGEAWEAFKESISEEKTAPVERSDARITDILRVKPKQKGNTQSDTRKGESTTEADTTSKSTPPTKAPSGAVKEQPGKSGNKKKGYIRWSSSDGGSNAGWTLEDTSSVEEKKLPATVEKMIPKDGSHWKVLGEGGEDGWQVVDDKGDVEWKIEYDDGEWKVTSTGDVPADAEWADPEYVWGPSGGALAEEDEYNSWPADDYRVPPGWTDPELIFSGFNDTWIQNDENQGKGEETSPILESGWKTDEFGNNSPTDVRENIPFGERRRIPSNKITASSTEQRTDSEASEAVSDDSSVDKPQNDQGKVGSKSWIPGSAIAQGGQEWVQGYGSKSWEGGNTGWNTEVGGETWVAANKNFDPWVPKIPGSKNVPEKPAAEDISTNKQDGSIRAWGTGYGSKTWKGDEWNSNVVWKTGFNGGLPLTTNNSTWTFPEQNNDKKKPETWSQPIPTSEEVPPTSKSAAPPNQRQDRTRVKWPVRPANRGNANRKPPPSRRTEGESWGDDYSVGGVVWKQKVDSTTPAPETSKPSNQENGWQGGSWAASPPGKQWQPTTAPWKTNAQPKSKNLIGVAWNAGDYPVDAAPAIWNQAQWTDPSGGPTWVFGGCKMSLKCGSKPADTADDSSDLSSPPDTPDDDSTMMTTVPPVINVAKGWPQRSKGGKSWKPPSKSWRPPKWMQPTPPPTSPDTMNPTMPWKYPPTPIMNWKKPTPPPAMWKQPPPTVIWTDTTPPPPSISWKPPPPPSPQMKWKKGPKPGKSWRPPPTKSWKPPSVPPSQSWTPSIATPPPDMWPTTKPDCKDTTEATPAPPNIEDDSDDSVDPPQIIIITKLPKGSAPTVDGKKDNSKQKLPFGPWVFPQRKNVPKSSKNRKDKSIPTSNSSKSRPSRPATNNSKQSNTLKGWPKGVPPPNFVWPSNSMRRWTTKGPQTFSTWKYPKYSKSNTWRQMFKKWMNGR